MRPFPTASMQHWQYLRETALLYQKKISNNYEVQTRITLRIEETQLGVQTAEKMAPVYKKIFLTEALCVFNYLLCSHAW